MNNLSAMLLCDMYKLSHRVQYPKGTERVYSTWTPRTSRIKEIDKVVSFGMQAFIQKYLVNFFNDNFFDRSKAAVVAEYVRVVKHTLGVEPDTKHIEDLHDLGYLPLEIKIIPEGTLVPLRVPVMTIVNTHPDFFWLTNYIETLASCELWQMSTSATIANEYRVMLEKFAEETGGAKEFVGFQGHDFSMRGMSSLESAISSGMGHLLSFVGTDTIPAIVGVENYYKGDVTTSLIGTSIPASEHSVACSYGDDNEAEYYMRLITEVYPTGFVSLVSDTWDLWNVINNIIAPMKDTILKREGKVVLRPDSGVPEDIICGNPNGVTLSERKGVIELLWDIFGGTVNSKGFKELDQHIGCIYGDAITLERCKTICERLKEKGFASTNMVYGIGSYTYQYNTRDTFGWALKSTLVTIDGKDKPIFKDPITDNGIKKSQRGAVVVHKENNILKFKDGMTLDEADNSKDDLLKVAFRNGKLWTESFETIRSRLRAQ